MNTNQTQNFELHIEGLKEGNESSFAYLYEFFESSLINHLYKMLGTQEKAEELFQEVMILMIKKIGFYQSREDLKSPFKAWLFRIATNLAIDELRKNKKQTQFLIPESDNTEDISESISRDDFNTKLGELIMLLPSIQRTFLNLRVTEDLSHKEIATICGCNIGAVKQGLFRARKNLKDLILDEGMGL